MSIEICAPKRIAHSDRGKWVGDLCELVGSRHQIPARLIDHNFGRIMNANIAECHVPVNADVQGIKVIFVDKPDDLVNPLGIKG